MLLFYSSATINTTIILCVMNVRYICLYTVYLTKRTTKTLTCVYSIYITMTYDKILINVVVRLNAKVVISFINILFISFKFQ